MINLNKKNQFVLNLIGNSFYSTKIEIYMSTKVMDSTSDTYEKHYIETNLNPHFIKGYVKDIKPSTLVWKPYGLSEIGSKEIICDGKYLDWFKNCSLIKIDSNKFHTFKEAVGNRCLITELPCNMIKVIIRKVE